LHGKKIDEIKKKMQDREEEAKKFAQSKAQRRADRKVQREKRAKDLAKDQFRTRIMEEVINKGDVKKFLENTEVVETGNKTDQKSLSVFGGHLQQIYYVVTAILELQSPEELDDYYSKKQANPSEVVKASNPTELMLEQYFMPFIVGYMKDLRSEAITIVATPEAAELLDSFKIAHASGYYELTKLTKEQYIRLRHLFCEERMKNPVWIENKNEQAMEMILAAFIMVMCKKLPADISCPPNLHTKIRLMAPKAAEKPCSAFVKLTFPMKKNEVPVRESAESAEVKQPEMVEIEQDDKCLAVNGNNAALDYSVVVIN
jgi:hypothetical protein